MASQQDTLLDTLLDNYELTDEECCMQVSDIHLDQFSSNCCSNKEWTFLPPYLEVEGTVVADINHENLSGKEKRLCFFKQWKQIKGSDATYRALISALLQINRRSDAEYLCNLLQARKATGTTNPATTTATTVAATTTTAVETVASSPFVPEQCLDHNTTTNTASSQSASITSTG